MTSKQPEMLNCHLTDEKSWCNKCDRCEIDCRHECLGVDCHAVDCPCDVCNDYCADQASELKIMCNDYWDDYACAIQER